MGIYDREYYKSSGRGVLDHFAGTGQVCKWLIIINIGVWLLQLVSMPREGAGLGRASLGPITDLLILQTDLVFSGQVWRLVTYAFLHDPGPGMPWHILFNMLFLWWFGRELESMYGPREFLTFYLIGAVLGGLAFVGYYGLVNLSDAGHVFDHTSRCLGASGAVTAVMVLFALHFPTRTILLFFILPIPIWVFVAFQVFQDFLVFTSGAKTRTAVTVHLAGALFGFLYYRNHWRVSTLWSGWNFKVGRRSKPRLRVYHGEDAMSEAITATPRSAVDEQLEAKLDAVLEKIKISGKESLTEAEQQLLLRASEIYRRRREGV